MIIVRGFGVPIVSAVVFALTYDEAVPPLLGVRGVPRWPPMPRTLQYQFGVALYNLTSTSHFAVSLHADHVTITLKTSSFT